ncbi:MAG: hypothetical protein GF411_13060 [Candidatus Lokiarchaeota archaeon]|nr:hypothetical protein [Candidatus Lokiarchaeota archaeon]
MGSREPYTEVKYWASYQNMVIIVDMEEFTVKLNEQFLDLRKLLNAIENSTEENEQAEPMIPEIFRMLFKTDLANELVEHVEKIHTFAVKGVVLHLPINKMMGAVDNMLNDQEIRERLLELGASDDERGIIEAISNYIDEFEVAEYQTHLLNVDDMRILCASIVSLLHSSIEQYTVRLSNYLMDDIDVVFDFGDICEGLLFNIDDMRGIVTDHDILRTKVIGHITNATSNPFTRFSMILQGLGLTEPFRKANEASALPRYVNLFKDFHDLRNKTVHEFVIPEIERYENWYTRQAIQVFEFDLTEDEQEMGEIPKSVLKLYEVILDWMNEKAPLISLFSRIPIMALVYPAMIDRTIHVWREVRKEDKN